MRKIFTRILHECSPECPNHHFDGEVVCMGLNDEVIDKTGLKLFPDNCPLNGSFPTGRCGECIHERNITCNLIGGSGSCNFEQVCEEKRT